MEYANRSDKFGVLLVDDEPYFREGLKKLIDWESHGFYIAGTASNGIDALELIDQLLPSVVITDIRMPEMDGLEFIHQATLQGRKNCRFIILSGHNDFRYAQTAIQYGVRKYILKPIEEDELIGALQELHTELAGCLQQEQQKVGSLRALAVATLRRIITGDIDADVAAFANQNFGASEGKAMQIILVESLETVNPHLTEGQDGVRTYQSDIARYIEPILQPNHTFNIMTDESGRFIVLATEIVLHGHTDGSTSLCDDLYNRLTIHSNIPVSVYGGKVVHSLAKIKDSYDSCISAWERNFFNQKSGVFLFDQFTALDLKHVFRQETIRSALLNTVQNNKIDAILVAVEEFFAELHRQNIAPDVARTAIASIMLDISTAVAEESGQPDQLLSRYSIKKMELMASGELKKYLVDFCITGAARIQALKEKQPQGMIAEVEKYVRRNFRSDLSVKSVAEHFYVNSTYLGQIFRRNHGMYFNDYLHYLRVTEANMLLRTTDLKISEIASQVGYSDPDYFIRKFKASQGVSPSQYRSANNLQRNGKGQ